MDKEKRIAELEERERQIKIEKAFYQGSKIEVIVKKWENDLWSETKEPIWDWKTCDYRIAVEPKRIPFDGSDAFNLTLRKFKHINDSFNESVVCIMATKEGVMLADTKVSYLELSVYWLKWNDILEVFEPCTKIA